MQIIIQLFRECDGFTITPEEVLVICLLNMIQEKSVLIKVQEQITEDSTWEEVRNLIVKIDSTSRISDNFKQKTASLVQQPESRPVGPAGRRGI